MAKNGIKMIKFFRLFGGRLMDHFKRNDFAVGHYRLEMFNRRFRSPSSVSQKQFIPRQPKRVALSFKKHVRRQIDDFVAVFLKEILEAFALSSSFGMIKIARDEFIFINKPGVGGKNHVRQTFNFLDEANIVPESVVNAEQSPPRNHAQNL